MTHKYFATRLSFLAPLAIVLFSCVSVRAFDDLTEITPAAADKLLIKMKGAWVLESIDMRPISEECVGKTKLEFSANHDVTIAECSNGHISNHTDKWQITSEGYGKLITIGGDKSEFYLKDEGKGWHHEYHMRVRQNDPRNVKTGMNLLHDYRFVPADAR